MAYRVKQWETSMAKQGPQGWVRTNVWHVESDTVEDDPKKIIEAVFGSVVPGKLTWEWDDDQGGKHTDTEIYMESISCRLQNRDQSRKMWVVEASYKDIRAMMATGRNRDSKRVNFPQ